MASNLKTMPQEDLERLAAFWRTQETIPGTLGDTAKQDFLAEVERRRNGGIWGAEWEEASGWAEEHRRRARGLPAAPLRPAPGFSWYD